MERWGDVMKWEIFKIPGKWLYRVGIVVPADLPWHPGYTVYATKGLIKGKPNAKKLAKRLNKRIGAAKKEAERA